MNGTVTIADREVSAYDLWSDTEIRVIVHSSTPTGPGETLIVETLGGADSLQIKVSC